MISVIVPVYNVKSYLSKCLWSLVNQTYNDIEIIVVDDCSTDDSHEICNDYLSKYNNIKYYRLEQNRGLSYARNYGIKKSTKEFIGFVDSDDWIDLNMYSKLYDMIINNNADLASCSYSYVYNSDKDIENYEVHNFNRIVDNPLITNPIDAHICSLKHGDIVVWNKLFKRQLFDNIEFPVGKIYEDIYTSYKLIEQTKRIYISSECLYYHRQREGSITRSSFSKSTLDYIHAVLSRYEYLANKYDSSELEQLYRNDIFDSLMGLTNSINHVIFAKDSNYSEYDKLREDIFNKYSFENCGFNSRTKELLLALKSNVQIYKIKKDLQDTWFI